MKKSEFVIAIIIMTVLAIALLYVATPQVRGMVNSLFRRVQMVDDNTRYSTMRTVEDTARAMIASHKADVLTWEQYRYSENEQEYSWSQQAKMRANKTASSYNNYLLKNRYVWRDNIPADIALELPVIVGEELHFGSGGGV